jgi:hypothetical protein
MKRIVKSPKRMSRPNALKALMRIERELVAVIENAPDQDLWAPALSYQTSHVFAAIALIRGLYAKEE